MTRRLLHTVFFAGLVMALASCFGSCSDSSGGTVRLATTTSVHDSGLLEVLLPAFEKKTGLKVEVAAVGSGKALKRLGASEADVAITHAPEAEKKAVAEGQAASRIPVMHNHFVIVGPSEQLSLVAGAGDVREVLQRLAKAEATFVSRGDGSGTHMREQALWKMAGLTPDAGFITATNAGMGETLKVASEKGAFALTDRATFVSRRDDLELAIVFQDDDELANVYAVLLPGGESSEGAKAFADFLRSAEGRALIGGFGVERFGEALFTPED